MRRGWQTNEPKRMQNDLICTAFGSGHLHREQAPNGGSRMPGAGASITLGNRAAGQKPGMADADRGR
jgi:hypothetical protein